MVKFLVQNSLGATWMGMYPDSDLSEGWEYYVKDADRAPVRRKNVENITFLDPACGSGHFLIEAFDLFYRMYEAEGKYTDEETICKKILRRNLYGIDIDERAVQIARAVLWMKAAERVFDFSGTPKNIIATNIRLPKGKDHLKAFLAKHPEDAPLQPALETIFEGLAHADELGSLLQIEEPVEKELRWLRERLGGQTTLATGGLTDQTHFAGQMTDEDWEAWKNGVIERLADHFTAEAEAADLVNAFFSQNAEKGVRLFELLSKRYDVVAANPPYMGSNSLNTSLKKYVETNYNSGKRDLFSSFIIRCWQLSKVNAKVAMVTQQSWLFLKQFAKFRSIDDSNMLKSHQFKGVLRETTLETLVHLGANAFNEISGEVVSVALFSFAKVIPSYDHKLVAFRLIEQNNSMEKDRLLQSSIYSSNKKIVSIVFQNKFLKIESSPICYWLNDNFLKIFSNDSLGNTCLVTRQVDTCENNIFLRYFWEIINPTDRWLKYLKAGGYSKWISFDQMYLDWNNSGSTLKCNLNKKYPYVKENYGWLIKESSFFQTGWTYSLVAQGCLGVRYLDGKHICDSVSPSIIPNSDIPGLGAVLNCRISSYLLRTISTDIKFREGYVSRLPLPENINERLVILEKLCIIAKDCLIQTDITERIYLNLLSKHNNLMRENIGHMLSLTLLSSVLHTIEYISEKFVFSGYNLSENDVFIIFSETGIPAGWYPLIPTYDTLPPSPKALLEMPSEVIDDLVQHNRLRLSPGNLATLKANLCTLDEAGPGARVDTEDDDTSDGGDEEAVAGAYIPIPAETFLEELSQKLQIHPISVYWLLKEGIEQEGWRCIPEERRITKDRFTVMILRMLGHRWPKQIEAGEPVPDWADVDGIIPLTSGTGEATLLERVRMRIAEEFPGGSVAAIEREFEEVMGKSLEDWLHTEFFKHHTQQFKKRPIAWQVQSGKFTKKKQPAFACMIYYHKLDEDTLHKIKNQYVGPLRQRYETEMRGIEGIPAASRNELQERRFRELEGLIAELKVFGETLTDVAENGFSSKTLEKIAKSEPLDSWCSIDGTRPAPADREAFLRQERSYIPDINDGVRVNVVPLQKAGLLAADVIAKKDLEKAVSDRAEWRADERRWCREGKLPKCGWWG
jgi:SAM-dependent methyltransferase